jgi:hypothetical protein
MRFRIQGLPRQAFASFFDQPDEVLHRHRAVRRTVDVSPGCPDRITLDDVPLGEQALLVNYDHQPAATPFRAAHAIYLWERAPVHWDRIDEIPPALARRVISLRAFDSRDYMIDADITAGTELPALIERMLSNPQARYLHAHYAKWGCYAARVDRV